ncbi:MAG: protein-tyrosine phosphatase family protein [Elusimicrobiales bacterium]
MTQHPQLNLKRASLFIFHLVCGGFFLGTLTLTGPVRWATTYARKAGWGETPEKLMVFAFIAALGVLSLLLARRLTAATEAAAGKAARYGLPALSLFFFLGAVAAWMNPKLMIDTGMKTTTESASWSEFVFGPYPEKDRLAGLKAEGYTAVISLLSQAVVPFEPVLLAREQGAAKEIGIEIIHIPMLPWVSSNDHVKARLKEIERRGPGKYYVHCYLGKDRVNVFRTMLSSASGGARVRSLAPANVRTLNDINKLERGAITVLRKDVFFTPYPTDEEYFGYILNGTVKSVASLLNPDNPDDLPWIKKEEAIAAKYGLKIVNYPWKKLDAAGRAKALREIRALERPVVIHAFLAHTADSIGFIAAYRGGAAAATPARPVLEGK